jgi:hypothetical protein
MTDDKILTGLASLALILVAGAVFGRLHGGGQNKNAAIGDRVMCGLLTLPLIALAVRLAFPQSSFFWALLGPAPVLIYTVLLATTEQGGMSHFTRTLLIAVGLVYAMMAALGFLQK